MKEFRFTKPSEQVKIGFMMTNVCNMRCEYCIVKDHLMPKKDIEQAKKLIDKVVEFGNFVGNPKFFVSGGEPFSHPELLEYFLDNECIDPKTVIIGTNGTLEKSIYRILNKYDVKIGVSLHYKDLKPSQLERLKRFVLKNAHRVAFVQALPEYGEQLPANLIALMRIIKLHKVHTKIVPAFLGKERWEHDLHLLKEFPYSADTPMLIDGREADANELYRPENPTEGMFCDTTKEYYFSFYGDSTECGYTLRNKKNLFKDTFEDIRRTEPIICPMKYCSTSMAIVEKWK